MFTFALCFYTDVASGKNIFLISAVIIVVVGGSAIFSEDNYYGKLICSATGGSTFSSAITAVPVESVPFQMTPLFSAEIITIPNESVPLPGGAASLAETVPITRRSCLVGSEGSHYQVELPLCQWWFPFQEELPFWQWRSPSSSLQWFLSMQGSNPFSSNRRTSHLRLWYCYTIWLMHKHNNISLSK